MGQITFADKSNASSSALPTVNKVRDVDMNEIKDTVNANDLLHSTLQTQVDDLEAIAGAVPLMYTYSSTTVEADPGAGNFRVDFITPEDASFLYISKTDLAFNLLTLWDSVVVGSFIYIKSRSSLAGGVLYGVGAVTDNTTWLKFTVAGVDGGPMTNGDICAIALFQPPAVGTGTVTSVTAGAGMTQTGTSTVNPTLNVIGGLGIDVNADDIDIDYGSATNSVITAAQDGTPTGANITVDAANDTVILKDATDDRVYEINVDQLPAGSGGIPTLTARTGSTIVFDDYSEYNAITPVTSGNITINPAGAVAGSYVGFYFNGATEPTISGATGQLESGTFAASELNIFHFFWNTNGQYVLNIQTTSVVLTQLTTPSISAVAGDTLIDLTFSNIDANATSNTLDRSTDNVNFSNVVGYDGTSLTYQDTGLTNTQIYYYRFNSQASGYLDSAYGVANATPNVAAGYLLDTYTGAAVAYSLRKLSTAAIYACQVERLADSATCDVLLETSGSISTSSDIANLSGGTGATLGAWLGSDNATVNIWYDQSGNANNAVRYLTNARPVIADALGTLFTSNGKPALKFDEIEPRSLVFTESFPTGGDLNSFNVVSPNASDSQAFWGSNEMTEQLVNWVTATSDLNFRAYDTANKTVSSVSTSGQQLIETRAVSSQGIYSYKNSTLVDSDLTFGTMAAISSELIGVGTYGPVTPIAVGSLDGFMQEFILYKSDQNTNKAAIDADINAFYSIY